MRWFAVPAMFLLAGCFGHCGLMPDGASWQDGALYDAMPAPGTLAGVVWSPPEQGLPFDLVIDASWGAHNLTEVRRDEGGRDEVSLWLTTDGLRARSTNRTTEAQFAAAVTMFVQHVADADPAAAVAALQANATLTHSFIRLGGERAMDFQLIEHAADLTGPLRIAKLYQSLQEAGAVQVGPLHATAGAWRFEFSVAHRAIVGDDFNLDVDARGHVAFEGLSPAERGEAGDEVDTETAYRQAVLAKLQELGLPTPSAEDIDVQGSIC